MDTWQKRRVVCRENQALSEFIWEKTQQLVADKKPTGKTLSDNLGITLYKAYSNVCGSKTHVSSLKDFSQIKGVGKWILRLTQEFFEVESGASQNDDIIMKGKKAKGTRRYMPQKNSVAYALLITLYRAISKGSEYMIRQELIDATEASGLSRVPIALEKGNKPGKYGSSSRDWYSGWSCMKTLVAKGLIVKSSCPAKYMLTEEGKEAARDCLKRSGETDSTTTRGQSSTGTNSDSDLEVTPVGIVEDMTIGSPSFNSPKKSIDVPSESLDRFLKMGYSKDQVLSAFHEISKTSQNKDIASLWPAVLCHLREKQVYDLSLDPVMSPRKYFSSSSNGSSLRDCQVAISTAKNSLTEKTPFNLRPCVSNERSVSKFYSDSSRANVKALPMPPLLFGERFVEAYEVILILDNREQFATQGSRSRKIIENICTQFQIQIKVRKLPVGDAIWIAKHKSLGSEYVLDFIIERKKIDDLRQSIKDNRYKDQKLRLLRCGLKKLIYVVEGDPNLSEAAEAIKTACFTTEILEGFNVQRTSGLGDTLRRYGFLTNSITKFYDSQSLEVEEGSLAICPAYEDFIKRCQTLEKITVSDVFAIQLMQVPQVTEETAEAVLDLYPTLLSLARAYSLLEGDISAQEEMLKNQSNNSVNASASRNIFQLVWGS